MCVCGGTLSKTLMGLNPGCRFKGMEVIHGRSMDVIDRCNEELLWLHQSISILLLSLPCTFTPQPSAFNLSMYVYITLWSFVYHSIQA